MNDQSLEKLYNFPPMYTKQRNQQIIETQKKKWCDLIYLFYQQNNMFVYKEDTLKKLFTNEKINRNVDPDFQKEIIQAILKEGRILNILDMKLLLKEDSRFLKYWNRYDSKASKQSFSYSEMLEYDESSSEKNAKIFDEKRTLAYKQYILPHPLSFYEDVFANFLDMSMSDGNGIFTVYEMSGIDALFGIKADKEKFLLDTELMEDNDVVEGRMDTQLTIYLLYKLLIEKGICYPIIEDDELVAIKKV